MKTAASRFRSCINKQEKIESTEDGQAAVEQEERKVKCLCYASEELLLVISLIEKSQEYRLGCDSCDSCDR